MPTKFIERGITRYDRDGDDLSNGYLVRATRDHKTHAKFFSDAKQGGKRKALAAARQALQELVAELPAVKTSKGVKTNRNRSGVVGVHLAETTSVYGETYSSYSAAWTEGDYRRKIVFGFKKYGKAAAFALAKIARSKELADRQKVEKLYTKQTGKTLKCYR